MLKNDIIIMVIILMKKIIINEISYEVLKDNDNIINVEQLNEMVTDYFINYDYIVGDVAYSHLRLKGFNEKTNAGFNKINDYSLIDNYIENKCAYGCKFFIIKKLNKRK